MSTAPRPARRKESPTRGAARAPLSSAAKAGAVVVALTAGVGGLGASCSGSGADSCLSTREFFAQDVWSGFMGQKCAKCHTPDGPAVAESNAKFVLQRESYPGFIDENLANIKTIAKISIDGKPELLVKAIGGGDHAGGPVLEEGSDDYKTLEDLIKRVQDGESCTPTPDATLEAVTLASAPATLRRAALDLAGRLPTDAELASVKKGGDAALDKALDGIMKEQAFFDRLREIYNDMLLTDRWLSYNGAAIDFLNKEDYPGIAPYRDSNDPAYKSDKRPLVNRALAREPLDLIAYVVKNGKPFTDVVGADYAVVNPFTAIAYGVDGTVPFQDPTDYEEFHEVKIKIATGFDIPHAGVLSTPSFLNRWTTTPTNRNRGRARRVAAFFLATDVLKIAMRPVDVTKLTETENPTRNSAACTVCHKVIDPIAGGFRGFGDSDYEDFDPNREWHDEMFPPGFDGENMGATDYPRALSWLGPKIGADPRFRISAVRTVYKGLTGRDPLPYPSDSADPEFQTKLRAWEAQDTFFRSTADAFAKGGHDLKLVVKAVVKSPYYRGVSLSGEADPGALADVGMGRLNTPEMLNRKIAAVTGVRWRKRWEWDRPHDYLLEDYPILYGGIDSLSTITRLTTANGVIASVASRMANEMACNLTAWDFTSKAGGRRFFPLVELTEVPESAGHTVDGSVADIKKNIQHLHKLFLDEDLAVTDPEIERTYQLFLDTWHELEKGGDQGLDWTCQGRIDPRDGTDLPEDVRIGKDENYTVRSWMAVMSYLMADYKFLYE